MARKASSSERHAAQRAETREVWGRRLESGAFFVLLLVVAMRPMLSETYTSSRHGIAEAVGGADLTSPATTAWFDMAIWLAGLTTAIATLIRKRRWQLTGVELGGAVLLLAAIVSTVAGASNQRVALNASADWLTALVLIAVLANLLHDRMRVTLLLAVIMASGAASAARCAMQVGVEYEETRAFYEQERYRIWQEQGVPLDDPRVALFEARMNAGEATGFFAHSNVAGTWLVLAAFAGLALAGGVGLSGPVRAALAIIGLIPALGLPLTGSRGAMAAGVVGLIVVGALWRVRDRLRRHWRRTLLGGWGIVLAGMMAVVLLGLARGGLPGDSLRFRWNYWQVTRDVIAAHPWTGTGALNFDRAYMQHKPIAYPEEIQDPHNFVLSLTAQWGVPGGLGLGLVLAGASWLAVKRWGTQSAEQPASPASEEDGTRPEVRWTIGLIVCFVVFRLWLLVQASRLGEGLGGMIVFDLGLYGLTWSVVLGLVLWLARPGVGSGRSSNGLVVFGGVLAFLLHSSIDIPLVQPGALTPFAAMAALLVAGKPRERDQAPSVVSRVLPVTCAALGLLIVFVTVFVPVTSSGRALARARSSPAPRAFRWYAEAADRDVLDPTPLQELAERLARAPDGRQLDGAIAAIEGAIRRDPEQIALRRMKASLHLARFRASGNDGDIKTAAEAARTALDLYPESPAAHAMLADILAIAGRELPDDDLLTEAAEHYRRALDLDAARPEHELRRWPPSRRAAILQRLSDLTATATQPSSTSQEP